MPTPKQGYRLKDGTRCPSVTTICGRFKESGGLIWWANRLALEPLLQIRSVLENGRDEAAIAAFLAVDPAAWDHKQAAARAADAGTIAHQMVDDFIHSREFDPSKFQPDLVEMAKPAYGAFREWADQSRLEIIETEKPLVSEQYKFGGTRDAIGLRGNRSILDWKSSNSIYPEYLLQLAAYGILDEEAGNQITGGYHLVRFSKQESPGDPVHFVHHYWDSLTKARAAFLLCRELYGLMAELEKLAK